MRQKVGDKLKNNQENVLILKYFIYVCAIIKAISLIRT